MIPGSKSGHPSFRKSFHFARQGFIGALKSERNINVMLLIGVVTIIAGFIIGLDLVSWAAVLACCAVVISAELMNTAIETTLDLVSPEFHPFAGRAKDIAAAAVWFASIMSALVGILVFANAILS